MDKLLAINRLDRGHGDYLDALGNVVASYEEQHSPTAPASDAHMLQHLLDAKGLTQTDLHRQTGIAKSIPACWRATCSRYRPNTAAIATAAVSIRRIERPRLRRSQPAASARSTSWSVKPPSGPMA